MRGRTRFWRIAALGLLLFAGAMLVTRFRSSQEPKSLTATVRYSENLPAPLFSGTALQNGCFVLVTRTISLTKVRRTMFDVEKRFNNRFNYPYVFLSEQPFSETFQRSVRKMTNASVIFGLINGEYWQYPEWINMDRAERAAEAWADANDVSADRSGWRHMVRFWAAPVAMHPALHQFKYMWRLEPGSHYTCDFTYDPFDYMQSHGLSYGFAISMEAMPDTVPTLWDAALEYIQSSKPQGENSLGWLISQPTWKSQYLHYNRCEFLTNFELVDLDFIRSEEYQQLFDYLDRKSGIYYEHWTDASIRSLAVALLLAPSKVRWFDDVGYKHDLLNNCPAGANRQMRCHCDPSKSSHLVPMSCSARWNLTASRIDFDTISSS
ncbi:hypothetical protein EDC05_006283 [Coemansia umbellata]|nr:hypothetical protein EDC05_006283 [Coemansia umbellata]